MKNTDKIIIFGYGSLINTKSLCATVPNPKNLRPAYIKGFRRKFNKIDKDGWTTSDFDVAGIPFCALNIYAKKNAAVNGVAFEVDSTYFIELKVRETDYVPIATTAYDFETNSPLGECSAFLAENCDGGYDFNGNPAQNRYLKTCLDGAKEYGEKFYREFLSTTYIGNRTLDEAPELI